jgi:hypothetical protein
MKRLLIAALLAGAGASPLAAQADIQRSQGSWITGSPITLSDGSRILLPSFQLRDSNGAAFGTSSNPLYISGGGSGGGADPNNKSFVYAPSGGSAENSTAASYNFSSANVAVARAWYADCPASTTVRVTMTDPNGGAAPVTLYDGHYGPVAERIASFSGNAAGCTIGLEF